MKTPIYMTRGRLAALGLLYLALCPASAAVAQTVAEQEALSRNCSVVGIGPCYQQGLNKMFNGTFLPQINTVLSDGNKNTLAAVRFVAMNDQNALGASSDYTNGTMSIRITSSVGYHVALFARAAVLALAMGKDLSIFQPYQDKVVSVLIDNTRRVRLGQAPLPAASAASVFGIDEAKATELLNTTTSLGLNAYFTEMMLFWIFAHETGHQLLGHTRVIAQNPNAPRKPMEKAADDFAARTMVKMGYSVYPTMFLFGYFSAIETAGAGNLNDYPPTVCRLAHVFSAAYAERASGGVAPRDGVNKSWNGVMDQTNLKQMISSISIAPQCTGS